MAEIKSTLDLIMEKTKNLTMTEAEKEDIRYKEGEKKARGWVKRYLNESLTLRDIQEYMGAEESKTPAMAPLLRKECLAHLEPEGDNEKIFQLFREILNIDTIPYQRLISDYHEEFLRHRDKAARDVLQILQKREISGSAVIPNPKLSPAWSGFLEAARKQFEEKLYRVK